MWNGFSSDWESWPIKTLHTLRSLGDVGRLVCGTHKARTEGECSFLNFLEGSLHTLVLLVTFPIVRLGAVFPVS